MGVKLSIPLKISAGDTLNFTLPEIDYTSADGWAMKVQLVNADTTKIIEGVYSSGEFSFTLSVSETASLTLGKYRATQYVEKGAAETLERHSITSVVTQVIPGLQDVAQDMRGHAGKMLEKIEAVLENRATTDVLKYEIRGRSLERMPVEDLIKWRSYYKAELKREEAAMSGKSLGSRRYRMSFR